MRKRNALIKVFISFMFIVVSTSGAVEIPNTFRAGDKARASEVNENFNAVKNAIDSLEGFKNNLSSGGCPDNQAIKRINADGTVVCENSFSTKKELSITLHGVCFATPSAQNSKGHKIAIEYGYVYPVDTDGSSAGTYLYYFCDLKLPEGAEIYKIVARLFDNDSYRNIGLQLREIGTRINDIATIATSGASTSWQRIEYVFSPPYVVPQERALVFVVIFPSDYAYSTTSYPPIRLSTITVYYRIDPLYTTPSP